MTYEFKFLTLDYRWNMGPKTTPARNWLLPRGSLKGIRERKYSGKRRTRRWSRWTRKGERCSGRERNNKRTWWPSQKAGGTFGGCQAGGTTLKQGKEIKEGQQVIKFWEKWWIVRGRQGQQVIKFREQWWIVRGRQGSASEKKKKKKVRGDDEEAEFEDDDVMFVDEKKPAAAGSSSAASDEDELNEEDLVHFPSKNWKQQEDEDDTMSVVSGEDGRSKRVLLTMMRRNYISGTFLLLWFHWQLSSTGRGITQDLSQNFKSTQKKSTEPQRLAITLYRK